MARWTLMGLMLAAVSAGWAGAQEAGAAADAAPVIVPEATELAMRYYRTGNVVWLAGQALGLAIPLLVLFSGWSARLRDAARRVARGRWFFTLAIYFVLYSSIEFLLGFPFDFYRSFVRQHEYGLSNQTLQKFLADSVIGLGVGMVFGLIAVTATYLLLAKSPRRWWLYTGALAVPFLFFVMLIQPVFVDPLFNDFGPMKDKALESRILEIAGRAGIDGARVFEVDKSVDTKAVNAYVTGFLGTKRIVLWDTLLAKLDADEVLYVMGHEMGHYVLGHVVRSILFLSLLLLAGLYAVHRCSGALIARFRGRFGFDALHDAASLPLILAIGGLLSLVLSPVALAYSRHNEHEADRFGLEITRTNRAAGTAFVKLQTENLGNPRPGLLYMLWRGSHPSIGERVDFMNVYRPWASGDPLRYEHLFREKAAP